MRGHGCGKNLTRGAGGAGGARNEASHRPSAEPERDERVCGLTIKNVSRGKRRGPKRGGRTSEGKVYLGVRVKMTVRDMLKNVRLTQGVGPEQLQDAFRNKEERVKTCSALREAKKRRLPKSLEELAIIVEVLEEDLKTPHTKSSSRPSIALCEPPASPGHSPALTGYSSDGSEDIPSPRPHMSYYPWTDYYQNFSPDHQALSPDHQAFSPDHQALSPDHQAFSTDHQAFSPDHQAMSPDHQALSPDHQALSPSPDHMSGFLASLEEQYCPRSWCSDSSVYFWTQLQKEEMVITDICDAELLATDEHGKNLLHNVVCVGKRALAYAVAKRMAAINSLDLKDLYGMTALHYAAKYNHHLMLCDLIQLGANINERNNMGKSCVHLCAEKGYTQVLEVLKQMMMDGYFVDVEATDNSGMSVLQCTAVALKATVCEVNSSSPLSSRLNSLHKEQMLETLEIVLQMGSYLHSMGCWGMPRSS